MDIIGDGGIVGNDGSDDKDYDDDSDNSGDVKNSIEKSISDAGSSDENLADPFTQLDLCDQIVRVDSKINNVNTPVRALDMKLDKVMKSIFEVKTVTPSMQEREK